MATRLHGARFALLAATATAATAAALLAGPLMAEAETVPGASAPPAATAEDKATIGTYAAKGAPPAAGGVSSSLRTRAKSLTAAAAEDCPNTCFFYNTASHDAATTGLFATMWISNPTVQKPDTHSLAELAAILHTDNGRQIVEVGWTVDNSMYTDGLPHLFVYRWVNGKPGCYNGCGWVAYADAKVKAGDPLPVGQAKQFGIQYDANSPKGGGWWIKYNGEFIGYFPSTLWSQDANPPVTFTETDNVQAFGEVAAGTTQPCSTMGVNKSKGSDGANGSPRPAFIASIAYVNGPAVAPNVFVSPETAATAYSVNAASARTFFYGGDGFC
ncbi:neprosin family prolyl endopeptidase [Actinoplanes sp. CA-030573]|uniref:neprosin family prolyl endopeptidase n=1 Tax=Actinoplanes sp. CA-030573 TaxID=3239898 RepID=UPI003D8AEE4A